MTSEEEETRDEEVDAELEHVLLRRHRHPCPPRSFLQHPHSSSTRIPSAHSLLQHLALARGAGGEGERGGDLWR
eukprot:2476030-Rhodomonas_salina.1